MKSRLLRFVIGPEDQLFFDVDLRLPGRGLWLCANKDCLDQAFKKNKFARAARQVVIIKADLRKMIEAQLKTRIFSLLSLARGAGELSEAKQEIKTKFQAQQINSPLNGDCNMTANKAKDIHLIACDAPEKLQQQFKGCDLRWYESDNEDACDDGNYADDPYIVGNVINYFTKADQGKLFHRAMTPYLHLKSGGLAMKIMVDFIKLQAIVDNKNLI